MVYVIIYYNKIYYLGIILYTRIIQRARETRKTFYFPQCFFLFFFFLLIFYYLGLLPSTEYRVAIIIHITYESDILLIVKKRERKNKRERETIRPNGMTPTDNNWKRVYDIGTYIIIILYTNTRVMNIDRIPKCSIKKY